MESFPHTASEREPVRVAQAAPGGADIATIPPKSLHRMVALNKTGRIYRKEPALGISSWRAPLQCGRLTWPTTPGTRQS